jgi:hypothetical protein
MISSNLKSDYLLLTSHNINRKKKKEGRFKIFDLPLSFFQKKEKKIFFFSLERKERKESKEKNENLKRKMRLIFIILFKEEIHFFVVVFESPHNYDDSSVFYK